ncbi:MAG: efflux RND transporter periplasmic adaptor subunit [Bacteroidota bacterium]
MKARIIFFSIAAVLSITLFGCSGKEEPKIEESHTEHSEIVQLSTEAIKEIKLETEIVSFRPFTGYLTIPAKVLTNQDNEAQIGSLVQGRVHQVFVKVGDFVKAGQILMTVEGLDVGEIKAGFLIAKAALDYTKANYERQKKLYDEKIGSQKSLLESQSEYEKALAEYKAEDKKIHSVGLSDADINDEKKSEEHTSGTLSIKSSINGIVVERNVVIGQSVDVTSNAFKIINTSNVWVDGQVYEKDIAKIYQKTNAVFSSATYQNEKFNGRIIYIGQTIDEQSRTITVRGEFSNTNGKLKPQMFGDLKIPIESNAKAIMMLDEAVVKEAGIEYVFVQTSDTTFEQRKVSTGTVVDGRIEIRAGLTIGEDVVSKGVFYLKSELKKEEIEGDEH